MAEQRDGTKRLLLVEDNPGDVELLRLALKRAEVECDLTVFDDGQEAIDLALQRGKHALASPPDLMILDLNVPKYNGLEILEALRANPAFEDLRVVVLTSSSSPRERASTERFHVIRYITKPLDLNEFLGIGLILKDLLFGSRESISAKA